MIDIPEIGSEWIHKNGNHYVVLAIANESATREDDYPIMVIYFNMKTKEVWSRPLSRWHGSMTIYKCPCYEANK